jgi:hypothetical protein
VSASCGLHHAATRRVVCPADPYAAAELTNWIKEQAVKLAEEMSKNKNKNKKRRRPVESDDDDDDEESADEDGNDSDEDDDDDSSPYAWIGKWIQKPRGERCRNPKDGREGFTTASLLKTTGITKEQYSMYKVCVQFVFRTTDSPQKAAHQLIGRYFDITKSYRTNIQNHPDSWALIIKKVCPISFTFNISDLPTDERMSSALPMACEELGDHPYHRHAP